MTQEAIPEDPKETRTFYVAAPGTGTFLGGLRKIGTFALLAAGGAAPVMLFRAVWPSPPAWLGWVPLFFYLAFLVYAWWFVVAHTRVHVGADGMRLVRHGRSRFFPIAAILGTNTSASAVTVFLDETLVGEHEILLVSLRTEHRGDASPVLEYSDPDIAVLASCLQSSIDDFSGARPPKIADALARSGRTVRQWAAALRMLGAGPDYRTAPVSRDELWGVVEDATKPPAIRAAAAVALRPSTDSERVRLRVQVETSATAGFRAALEAILDSEGDIEERLQGLEEEQAATTHEG